MNRAKAILTRLLHPPKQILISTPCIVFPALIFIFAAEKTESAAAYPIYFMSAYSLCIILAASPALIKKFRLSVSNSRLMQRAARSRFVGKYLNDLAFRGGVNIYQGMLSNFLYMIFRISAGIRFHSIWFITLAVYYLVLGGVRAYLIVNYHRRDVKKEHRCYRHTALLLFLLNIPMGGMIILMVQINSGFTYPVYVIYLSALYTFYATIMSIINIVRYRRFGSPLLSAARVINFVSAMMSILCLQTSMISCFSINGESYRKMMNAITGGFVWGIVILIAACMLLRSRVMERRTESDE